MLTKGNNYIVTKCGLMFFVFNSSCDDGEKTCQVIVKLIKKCYWMLKNNETLTQSVHDARRLTVRLPSLHQSITKIFSSQRKIQVGCFKIKMAGKVKKY